MASGPAKDAVATNVVSMMSSLTDATEMAGQLVGVANSVCDTVTAVANKSHEVLMELTREAASIAQAEVSEFRDAMRDTEATGNGLKQRCLELTQKWNSFEEYIRDSFDKGPIGRDEVQQCIQLLQIMLECAGKCGSCYQVFKEKLNHAIKVGSRLAERCRVAAEDARSKASNTKLVGYGATGALGAAALGFLTFATGGLALVGAVAAGAAAVGAGAYTQDRVRKLDKLATEFDDLRGDLDNALRNLNHLGDSITGLFAVTETMVEKMEIALKFFKEHERVRQESEETKVANERLTQENADLEKQLAELQAGKKKKPKSSGSRKCRNM